MKQLKTSPKRKWDDVPNSADKFKASPLKKTAQETAKIKCIPEYEGFIAAYCCCYGDMVILSDSNKMCYVRDVTRGAKPAFIALSTPGVNYPVVKCNFDSRIEENGLTRVIGFDCSNRINVFDINVDNRYSHSFVDVNGLQDDEAITFIRYAGAAILVGTAKHNVFVCVREHTSYQAVRLACALNSNGNNNALIDLFQSGVQLLGLGNSTADTPAPGISDQGAKLQVLKMLTFPAHQSSKGGHTDNCLLVISPCQCSMWCKWTTPHDVECLWGPGKGTDGSLVRHQDTQKSNITALISRDVTSCYDTTKKRKTIVSCELIDACLIPCSCAAKKRNTVLLLVLSMVRSECGSQELWMHLMDCLVPRGSSHGPALTLTHRLFITQQFEYTAFSAASKSRVPLPNMCTRLYFASSSDQNCSNSSVASTLPELTTKSTSSDVTQALRSTEGTIIVTWASTAVGSKEHGVSASSQLSTVQLVPSSLVPITPSVSNLTPVLVADVPNIHSGVFLSDIVDHTLHTTSRSMNGAAPVPLTYGMKADTRSFAILERRGCISWLIPPMFVSAEDTHYVSFDNRITQLPNADSTSLTASSTNLWVNAVREMLEMMVADAATSAMSDLVSGNSPKLILQYIVKVTNAELVFCLKQLSMDYALGRDSESNGHAAWSNRPYANRKLGPIPFSVKLDQRLKHHQHYVLVLHSLGIWRFITLLQPSAEEPLWTCVLRTYGHSIAIANFHDVLIEFQSRIRSQESVTHKVLEEAQAHTPSMNGTPTSANGVMVDASTKGGYDGMYAITLLHVTEVLKRCTGREDATSLSTPFELLFCQEVCHFTYGVQRLVAELPKVSVHPAGKDGLPVLDWLQCMVGTTSVLISAIHAMDREVQLLLNTIQHCPEPDFIHQLNYELNDTLVSMLINLHKGCKLNNIQVPSVSLDGEGQVEKVLVGWKRNVDGLLIERLTILIFENFLNNIKVSNQPVTSLMAQEYVKLQDMAINVLLRLAEPTGILNICVSYFCMFGLLESMDLLSSMDTASHLVPRVQALLSDRGHWSTQQFLASYTSHAAVEDTPLAPKTSITSNGLPLVVYCWQWFARQQRFTELLTWENLCRTAANTSYFELFLKDHAHLSWLYHIKTNGYRTAAGAALEHGVAVLHHLSDAGGAATTVPHRAHASKDKDLHTGGPMQPSKTGKALLSLAKLCHLASKTAAHVPSVTIPSNVNSGALVGSVLLKEDEHMKGSIQRALDWTRAVELVYDHASPLSEGYMSVSPLVLKTPPSSYTPLSFAATAHYIHTQRLPRHLIIPSLVDLALKGFSSNSPTRLYPIVPNTPTELSLTTSFLSITPLSAPGSEGNGSPTSTTNGILDTSPRFPFSPVVHRGRQFASQFTAGSGASEGRQRGRGQSMDESYIAVQVFLDFRAKLMGSAFRLLQYLVFEEVGAAAAPDQRSSSSVDMLCEGAALRRQLDVWCSGNAGDNRDIKCPFGHSAGGTHSAEMLDLTALFTQYDKHPLLRQATAMWLACLSIEMPKWIDIVTMSPGNDADARVTSTAKDMWQERLRDTLLYRTVYEVTKDLAEREFNSAEFNSAEWILFPLQLLIQECAMSEQVWTSAVLVLSSAEESEGISVSGLLPLTPDTLSGLVVCCRTCVKSAQMEFFDNMDSL